MKVAPAGLLTLSAGPAAPGFCWTRCHAAAGRILCCSATSDPSSGAERGARVQPGHDSCPQEKRGAGLSVRLLPRPAPTNQPGSSHVSARTSLLIGRHT